MPPARLLAAAAVLTFLVVATRCAWMSDDAFITLRHLEHLCAGHGLRYNVAERVQGFTHPLWALALLPGHALTRNPFHPPILLSLATSGLAVALVVARAAPSPAAGALCVVVLTGCKGFVDFSTSGLENPLTHLLLAGFAAELLGPRRPLWIGLLAGLLLTNRLDTVLLVGPGVVWCAATSTGRVQLLWGLAPLALWESFALIYYGFPFPNTAYAKLGHGIERADLVVSGLKWLRWCAWTDPSTVLLLLLSPAALFAHRRRPVAALLAGAALYVAYVVGVGGDFMASRFLSAPSLLAGVALAHLPLRVVGVGAGLLTVLSVIPPTSPWRSGPDYQKATAFDGVVDERGYYWDGAGWLSDRPGPRPNHRFVRTGRRLGASDTQEVVKATVGFVGYYAGPDKHIIDPLGLTDPLLARLPAEYDPDWRIGHFRRHVPDGYAGGAAEGAPLSDPALEELAAALRVVTRGPLFSRERLATLVGFQLGRYGRLVDRPRYRYPDAHLAEPGPTEVRPKGVRIPVTGPVTVELGPARWTVLADRDGRALDTWQLTGGTWEVDPPAGTQELVWFTDRPARILSWEAP